MRPLAALAALVVTAAACGSAPARNQAPFCDKVREIQAADPFKGVADGAAAVARGTALLDELAAVAPVSIKGDVRVLRRALEDVAKQGPQAATAVLSQPEVLSAARSVASTVQHDCGIAGGIGGIGT